jgi:hypothetical protein
MLQVCYVIWVHIKFSEKYLKVRRCWCCIKEDFWNINHHTRNNIIFHLSISRVTTLDPITKVLDVLVDWIKIRLFSTKKNLGRIGSHDSHLTCLRIQFRKAHFYNFIPLCSVMLTAESLLQRQCEITLSSKKKRKIR